MGYRGKAERLVRTLLGEWAYARPFADTAERIALLPVFPDFYNRQGEPKGEEDPEKCSREQAGLRAVWLDP